MKRREFFKTIAAAAAGATPGAYLLRHYGAPTPGTCYRPIANDIIRPLLPDIRAAMRAESWRSVMRLALPPAKI